MTRGRLLGATAGLTLGLGVAGTVAVLLGRVVRLSGEIERYATDIAAGAEGIVGNLAGADGLGRTGELAAALLSLVSGGEAQ